MLVNRSPATHQDPDPIHSSGPRLRWRGTSLDVPALSCSGCDCCSTAVGSHRSHHPGENQDGLPAGGAIPAPTDAGVGPADIVDRRGSIFGSAERLQKRLQSTLGVTLACDSPGVETGFPAVLAQRDAIFPALIFAVGAMIVASLFTASPAAEQLAEFES